MNESDLRPLVRDHTVTQELVGLSTKRPVRAEMRSMERTVWPHDHTYYEICIINNGRGIHQTDFFHAPVRQGSVVVIPPGKVHGFVEGYQMAGTNIYYLAEWLLGELKQLWEHEGLVPLFLADSLFPHTNHARPFQFDLEPREYQSVMIDLEDMQRESNMPQPSVLFMGSCFLKLLIVLSRSQVRQAPREMGLQFRRETWLAMDCVENSLQNSQRFSVAELARENGISADHFTRLFREATGWSPLEYFQMRRVHHACRFLLDPEAKISDIAYRLGYADAAHLSRMFKRFRQLSPRQYRQMYNAKQPGPAEAQVRAGH